MMVLTDANSVPKGRNDRITGKGLNGDRIGTHHLTDVLGPKQLNFIDTYMHKHPEGALMTHHNKTAKSYSRIDQIWIKRIHSNQDEAPIRIIEAGSIQTGDNLGSDHTPIIAILAGTYLPGSPRYNATGEVEKLEPAPPTPLPPKYSTPPEYQQKCWK